MRKFFISLLFDVKTYAEELTGFSVCFVSFNISTVQNELIKSVFSMVTALMSAWLVHQAKKNNFSPKKFLQMIKKSFKKNNRKKL